MKILVIGNGFDIVHNLKTKYSDFLQYCDDYSAENPISQIVEQQEEFDYFLENNFWLKYFRKTNRKYCQETNNKYCQENWIDCENEIANFIYNFNSVDGTIDRTFDSNKTKFIIRLHNSVPTDKFKAFMNLIGHRMRDDKCKYYYRIDIDYIIEEDTLFEFLYNQLRNFARSFELYCLKINNSPIFRNQSIIFTDRKIKTDELESKIQKVERSLEINRTNLTDPEIKQKNEEISNYKKELANLKAEIKPIDYLSMSIFDCILNFNYTSVFEILYGNNIQKYSYIHGKAQGDREKTNIVIGTDDYLLRQQLNINSEWDKFFKNFQKLFYKTDSEYKYWLENPDKTNNQIHIVGHSLGETDFDVMHELFNNVNFQIIIYYYSQEDFVEKYNKVKNILGYNNNNGNEELKNRTLATKPSIKFVDQYDKNDGLFINTKK
jgi:hypothetical protein